MGTGVHNKLHSAQACCVYVLANELCKMLHVFHQHAVDLVDNLPDHLVICTPRAAQIETNITDSIAQETSTDTSTSRAPIMQTNAELRGRAHKKR